MEVNGQPHFPVTVSQKNIAGIYWMRLGAPQNRSWRLEEQKNVLPLEPLTVSSGCLATTQTTLISILRLETFLALYFFLIRTNCTVQVTSCFRCWGGGGGGGASLRCKNEHDYVRNIDTRASWHKNNAFSSEIDTQFVTSELTTYPT
jgi:hypothetical protein